MPDVRYVVAVGNTPYGTVQRVSQAQADVLIGNGVAELISHPTPVEATSEPETPTRTVVTATAIRSWAKKNNVACPAKGKIPEEVKALYAAAH